MHQCLKFILFGATLHLEVCHPRCVCENWKGYVVKHNYVTLDVLITILDNYMCRLLLAIFTCARARTIIVRT